MLKQVISAAAIAVFSGGLALAQTAGTTTGTSGSDGSAAGSSGFSSWDQTTRDAFFNNGQLRSETEVRSGWDALDAEQQAQIKTECQNMSASAGGTAGTQQQAGTNADSGGAVSNDTTASTTTDSAAGASGAMPDTMAMQQFCQQVGSF